MCKDEKDDYQLPYSNEWLEQHKEYEFKRLIKELKRLEEEERKKPYIIRVINKIISTIQFYWIDIVMSIRMRFDKTFREEIESIIKEQERKRQERE